MTGQASRRMAAWAGAAWPLAALLAALALALVLRLDEALSLDALKAREAALFAWVEARPVAAAALFLALTAALMAVGFPSVGVFMVAGGYLFGLPGAVWAAAGAALGGLVFFLAARRAAQAATARMPAPWARAAERLRAGFARNAFLQLLSLRFLPIMPFIATTLTAAAAHMRAWPFLSATFLGTLPAALVYGGLGVGARAVTSGEASLSAAMREPAFLAALGVMTLLAFLTALLRRRGEA